jgi:hypothetical protein
MIARSRAVVLALAFTTGTATAAPESVAEQGKTRALASKLDWDVREAQHPELGYVYFAHLREPFMTEIGRAKVYSNAYISCSPATKTIAIELTNQSRLDDPGGLKPSAMPRLICVGPAPGIGTHTVQQLLDAEWHVSGIGDAMARGFRPSVLRECAAIGVLERVELPSGSSQPVATIEFQIPPFARELDSVFVACGEATAYATPVPAARAPSVATAPASPAPPVAKVGPATTSPPVTPQATETAWRTARSIAAGRTNVRAAPDLRAAIVAQVPPGTVLLARQSEGDWWHVKPYRGRAKFDGYIRVDRLDLR